MVSIRLLYFRSSFIGSYSGESSVGWPLSFRKSTFGVIFSVSVQRFELGNKALYDSSLCKSEFCSPSKWLFICSGWRWRLSWWAASPKLEFSVAWPSSFYSSWYPGRFYWLFVRSAIIRILDNILIKELLAFHEGGSNLSSLLIRMNAWSVNTPIVLIKN